MNLKAINIDKLDEKEQEQLRFLSNQYQFHLNQFQQFQKQQILSGNFESSIGIGANNSARNNNGTTTGLTNSGKTQSTIRYTNNQSGFSGRLNEHNPKDNLNGSAMGDLQAKSHLQLTEQKHIEVDNMG